MMYINALFYKPYQIKTSEDEEEEEGKSIKRIEDSSITISSSTQQIQKASKTKGLTKKTSFALGLSSFKRTFSNKSNSKIASQSPSVMIDKEFFIKFASEAFGLSNEIWLMRNFGDGSYRGPTIEKSPFGKVLIVSLGNIGIEKDKNSVPYFFACLNLFEQAIIEYQHSFGGIVVVFIQVSKCVCFVTRNE